MWRPNAVQLKNVKSSNVCNYFSTSNLDGSPCMKKAWGLRVYKQEKLISASKPNWFLAAKLVLKPGQCQRII